MPFRKHSDSSPQLPGDIMGRIYAVVLEPDPTGGFVVTAPAIPEAISQGETVAEAIANIREAIEGCLHVRRELGEEIPPSDADARLELITIDNVAA
jgi:predicted RNase H-like HicB family nuclease